MVELSLHLSQVTDLDHFPAYNRKYQIGLKVLMLSGEGRMPGRIPVTSQLIMNPHN